MLNFLFIAQEPIAGATAHSSESMLEYYCPQLSSQNVDFIYHVMEYCPKNLVFWKGEFSELVIQLKAEGEPLPREITQNFSLRRPRHVLSGQKRKRNFKYNVQHQDLRM